MRPPTPMLAAKDHLREALDALPDDVTFDEALARLRRVAAGATARVHTKADVCRTITAHAAALRALGVERVRLFGSFVRDTAGPESDVDLLVDFAPGRLTLEALLATGAFMEERMQRRVELLTPEGLSPYLGPSILDEAEDVVLAP